MRIGSVKKASEWQTESGSRYRQEQKTQAAIHGRKRTMAPCEQRRSGNRAGRNSTAAVGSQPERIPGMRLRGHDRLSGQNRYAGDPPGDSACARMTRTEHSLSDCAKPANSSANQANDCKSG